MDRHQAIEELKYTFSACTIESFPGLPLNDLPRILAVGVKVLKKRDSEYNCFSYALGVTHKWIQPSNFIGAPRAALDAMMNEHDFVACRVLDYEFRPHIRKVVLFGHSGREWPTHAALRVANGWESKMGRGALIFHPSLPMLVGERYGKPMYVYQKIVYNGHFRGSSI